MMIQQCFLRVISLFKAEFIPVIFGFDAFVLFGSLFWAWFFCYFANLATERVSIIGDTVYGLNWFNQPIDMQKYMILMILRSHERINFFGLGMIPCSLEAFGKVCTLFWLALIVI